MSTNLIEQLHNDRQIDRVIDLSGGVVFQTPNRRLNDTPVPDLGELRADPVTEFARNLFDQFNNNHGLAYFSLDNPTAQAYLARQTGGAFKVLFSDATYSNGEPGQAIAIVMTETPTNPRYGDFIHIKYLGSKRKDRFEANTYHDPNHQNFNLDETLLILSGFYELGQTGGEKSHKLGIADPAHYTTALMRFNPGTEIFRKLSQDPHYAHSFDRLQTSVQLTQAASASTIEQAGESVFPIVQSSEFIPFEGTDRPYMVVLNEDLIDTERSNRTTGLTLKKAIPGAIETMQRVGIATLIRKGSQDLLAREIHAIRNLEARRLT